MTDRALSGRHVLVTGAGGGIGAAIAARLVRAGGRVTLAGRRREPLQTLSATLGAADTYIAADFDVTNRAAIEAGLEAARATFGPVSILVNNAGQAPSAPFEKTSAGLWNQVIAVDLTGVFNVTQAVLPDLKAGGEGGRILNIASTAGLAGYAYVAAYCAAKHGVLGLTRALALELAKTGITVNAICPGFTDTPIIARSIDEIVKKTSRTPEEILKEFVKANPQGRLIKPEEVAETVFWLALPSAQSINGQAIAIAGGEVMPG